MLQYAQCAELHTVVFLVPWGACSGVLGVLGIMLEYAKCTVVHVTVF